MSKAIRISIFIFVLVLFAISKVDEDFIGNVGFLKITSARNFEPSDNIYQAEKIFRKLLSNNPDLTKAYRGLGFALAMQGRINDAKDVWPEENLQIAAIFTSWGDLANLEFDYDSALYWYGEALIIDSSLGRVWHEVGLIQQRRLQFNDAFLSFQEAISSGYIDGIHTTAQILLDNEDYNRAISILINALEDYPRGEDRLKWYHDLADSFKADKQWDAASEIARTGINEFPEDSYLYVQLGQSLYYGKADLLKAPTRVVISKM